MPAIAAGLSLEIHWLAYQEQFRAYCRSRDGMISAPAKIILPIDVRRA
jgi:hypothetical protein